ncbi:unnamed protein product [Heterobilharzia americana]|nr:unnamed protein product [Heterobilharzia americana]
MHSSPGRGVPHNKQMVGSQLSVDSYGNKKTTSTHPNNSYKSSYERSNHSTVSQSIPSYSDANSLSNQQQQSQYRYSDSYNLHCQTDSNPRSLTNYPDGVNSTSSVYTSPEYNPNNSDLCTQTNQLQSYLHRVSCGLSQCPQCYPYHHFIAQSYNLPNNGTTLQPSLVLSPTVLNNYSTSAICCPSATQIPYYFWYNHDPEYQKQYYQTQLGISKLNVDQTCPNPCIMIPPESDLIQTVAATNQTRQNESSYCMDPSILASGSLVENVNTVVHPSSLIMPMARSVAVTCTVNSSNLLSSKTNDTSVVNQTDYSNASISQLNGYTAVPIDSVYDPATSAWYPGYWNSSNLWLSSTPQGSYLPSYNRSTLPISSFSPNSQAFNPDDYTTIHQQYINSMSGDFSGVVNALNHPTTDLLTNYNFRDGISLNQPSQSSQQMMMLHSNTSSMPSSISSTTTSSLAAGTSVSSTPTHKISLSSNQKEYYSSPYYANPKSNDSFTGLQSTQYCSYPLPYYNTNGTVTNMLTNNSSTVSNIAHNSNISGNNSNSSNNNNSANNMRLILTLLANSRANATAITTPNFVPTPYRYSPDRNSLLYNRQKISVNNNSSNTNTTRCISKTFPDSELARLNLNVNPTRFDVSLVHRARYFIIKSDYAYNVHQSMKYGVWCSTRTGNQCLDEAYRSVRAPTGITTTTTVGVSKNDNNNNNGNSCVGAGASAAGDNEYELVIGQSHNDQIITNTTNNDNNNNNRNESHPTNDQGINDCATVTVSMDSFDHNDMTINNNDKSDLANSKTVRIDSTNLNKPVVIPGTTTSKSKRSLPMSNFNTTSNSAPGHIILFFSIRESGYLSGVAEMVSPVNSQKRSTICKIYGLEESSLFGGCISSTFQIK